MISDAHSLERTRFRRGFSLVELMVAVALLAVVLAGVFESFTSQKRTHVVVDQTTEAQQNLRAVVDLIERDVRRSGYLVPPAAAVCGVDATTTPDALFVSKTDAIRSVGDLESIDPSLIQGRLGAPLTSAAGPGWQTTGSVPLTRLWVDIAADGPDFATGEGVIVTDRNDPNGQVACGIIGSISGNTLTVAFGGSLLTAGGGPLDLIAVPAHVYRIDTTGGGSRLTRDGLVIANDVEDLQVEYFVDLDDDRVVDGAAEVFGSAGGSAYPPATTIDLHLLQELRVSVVTITRGDDPNRRFTPMRGQATGNRTTASLPGPDRRRRRVHTATVRLRNT